MSIQLAAYVSYAVIAVIALTIVTRKEPNTIDPLWFIGEISLTALMCYVVSLADEAYIESTFIDGLIVLGLASGALVLKHVNQPGKLTG